MGYKNFLFKKISVLTENPGFDGFSGMYSGPYMKKNCKNFTGRDYLQRLKIMLVPFLLMLFYLFSVFLPFMIFEKDLYGSNEGWLKTDNPPGELVWVNTSHWETRMVYKKDGYYRDVTRPRYVDTSYTISQGYYKSGEYRVWVEEKSMQSYVAKRYVDTSHWETRYRTVTKIVPVNFTVINGTDSYGWSVYSFASQARGMQQVSYNGAQYMAVVYVIDYRPARGGRVYATKYLFQYKFVAVQESYSVMVSSGYWENYSVRYLADTSHWETRTGRYWVDTSYRVTAGYWEDYYEKEWVDTSRYESENFWVTDGFYEEPIHGKVTVRKDPQYVFTRWHKDNGGNECGMNLRVDWEIDSAGLLSGQVPKKIISANIFQEVTRYKNRGIDKVVIYNGNVNPSAEGFISTFTLFNFAGNEDSILHIFLYAEGGQIIHVYFSNPVNGFKSININLQGTSSDPERWLGGNNYGEIMF
jgi:hypothetical protein